MDWGVSRIRFFKKSGARLYIPEKVAKSGFFPFKDDELVKIRVGEGSLTVERVEWWEMIDWNEMRDAYEVLPEEVKRKIEKQGLAPAEKEVTARMP